MRGHDRHCLINELMCVFVCDSLTQWEADLITHSQKLTEGHLVFRR